MEKVKILRKEFWHGIKQNEKIIEVDKWEAERLLTDTSSLDIFYLLIGEKETNPK